jgi:hypothetical protein
MIIFRSLYPFLLLWDVSRGFIVPDPQTPYCFLGSDRCRKRSIPVATSESLQRTKCYAGFKSNPFDDGEWKAGNVYEDLDRLEQAINLENAEQNLLHHERIEVLDHMAKERRPLFPDVQKFLIAPMICALLIRSCNEYSSTRLIARLLAMTMDLHFWGVVVSAPLLVLALKRVYSGPPEPMPEELKDLAPEYLPFATTDWESPETSCRDNVLFLLELWTSAVAGMAVAGIVRLLQRVPQYPGVRLWWTLSQLLTRIGAIAALYQYPKQMFQLRRPERPKPLGFFPTLMQNLVRGMLLLAPVGIATDLSKVVSLMGNESVVSLYSCISAFLLATWVRMQQTDKRSFAKLGKPSFFRRLRDTVAMALFWRKPWRNFNARISNLSFNPSINQWQRKSLKTVVTFVASSFLFLTPIAA